MLLDTHQNFDIIKNMMVPLNTASDTGFARFLAVSARELANDPKVTPLGAFDQLQRIHRKYSDRWLAIWLVCMDKYADITPNMPLNDVIHRIEAHGGPAGILGIAVINRQFSFLKKPLRSGSKVSKLLDECGNVAAERFLKIAEGLVKTGLLDKGKF